MPLCFSCFHIWESFLQDDLQGAIWCGPGFRLSFLFSLLDAYPACKEGLTPSSSSAASRHVRATHSGSLCCAKDVMRTVEFPRVQLQQLCCNFPCWLQFFQRWTLKFKWGRSAGGRGWEDSCRLSHLQMHKTSCSSEIRNLCGSSVCALACIPCSLNCCQPWSWKCLSQKLCLYTINLICEISQCWISLYSKGGQLEESFLLGWPHTILWKTAKQSSCPTQYIDSDCIDMTKNDKHDVILN